ncbi:MAG: polyprenyl synthetase family protein [Gemmatimonadota bacterium]
MSLAFSLEDYLQERREGVERALERAVAELESRVPEPVLVAVRHGVLSGGKRLRPIFCVAAYEACGGTLSRSLFDLAASLELIHAYSLMHDDLPCMDDADLRRGRPSTHAAMGEDVTMVAGALLIPAAARRAREAGLELELTGAEASEVAGVLMRAAGAGGMVGGQWLDLEGEGRLLTEIELDELHRHKTGALLVASLQMGALAAGADAMAFESLTRYGSAVGLAFQVADDILDATSDAETLGKEPSDAVLDKSTYVTLHGLEEARVRARALVDDAKQALEEGGTYAPALQALADFVVGRER